MKMFGLGHHGSDRAPAQDDIVRRHGHRDVRWALALSLVWSLACSNTQGAAAQSAADEAINAADCKTLLSWSAYAGLDGVPPSCAGQPCSSFAGVTCDAKGRVTKLALSDNDLSGGALPLQWVALTELTYLSLFNNNLSGTLPPQWGALTGLTHLYLYNNSLSGTLPPQWGALTKLTDLSLSGNKLSGTLAPQWGAWTGLTYLSLSSNKLSGTLAPQWGALTGLTYLSLSGNELSGMLPSQWGALTRLTYLYLHNNNLNGTLPPQWGALTKLADLFLYNNNLSGTLPPQWGALTGLTGLRLENTSLSGPLPTSWQKMSFFELDTAGTALCGPNTKVLVCPSPSPVSKPAPAPNPLPIPTPTAGPAPAPGASPAPSPAPTPLPPPPKPKIGLVLGVAVPIAAVLIAAVVAVAVVLKKRGLRGLLPSLPFGLPPSLRPAPDSSKPPARDSDVPGAQPHRASQPEGATVLSIGPAAAPHQPQLPAQTAETTASTAAAPPTGPPPGPQQQPPGSQHSGPATLVLPYRPGPPVAGGGIAPVPLLATPGGVPDSHGPEPNGSWSEVAAVVAQDVAVMLPKCISLGLKIVEASERVVANNARCSQLVLRINTLQPFLRQLQETMHRAHAAGDTSQMQGQYNDQLLAPVLGSIHQIFTEVHGCIQSWCAPTRLGAVITVLRNMATASWFQEGFVELNLRLSGAVIDLCAAMQIQDRAIRVPDKKTLEEETRRQTEADMQGLVVDLAAIQLDGRDSWANLEQEDKAKVASIFEHHKLDLKKTVQQARKEALEQAGGQLLIPLADVSKGRQIGKGGYGEVYAGAWKVRPVALKWLNTGPMSDRDRADVLREAFIHNRAHNHPNVCPLYGVVMEQDACVLVMELADGDLLQLIADPDDALPTRRMYELALDVACGMEHLHSKGIVHGDLKPNNLLVRKSGSVAVADFGLSSITCLTLSASITAARGGLTSESVALTVCYSPPELLDGRVTRKTQEADVYSFGMVLLEVFTGERPFGHMPMEVVRLKVLEGGKPAVPAHVPAACAQLVHSCLEYDAGNRPSFRQISATLQQLLAGCQ